MADFTKNRFDSQSVEWETPDEIFAPLNKEFNFTCDVAASPENAKVGIYFTKEDDALSRKWHGRCWMNPPYGRDLPKWLQKALDESYKGVITVCLIPARTNTAWFHELCFNQAEVRFIKGRPKFNNADFGLPFPLAIVIYRRKYKGINLN